MVKRNSFDRDGRSNKRRKSNDGRRIERPPPSSECSVFVGNLRYETKWQALKDHMRKAGNVDSANILEAPNGRSKGCALVTYQHPKEAQRAIKELNETELEGRTIFVQPDTGNPRDADRGNHNDSSASNNKNSNGFNVFVGNLPYECSWQALKDYFKTCGYIEHAEVMEDPNTGRKKGFGIVTFSNERAMENAIRKFDGSDFQGRTIEVRQDKKSGSAANASRNNNHHNDSGGECKVYFGNLDYNCSWQDLKDLVKRCGKVEHVDIPKKGWGIVTFASKRDGQTAISSLDKVVFQKRALEVRWDGSTLGKDRPNKNSNAGNSNAKQLYVGNLPYDCTWQNLKDKFKRFGAVSHAEVCETAQGRTTGFGIVAFVKPSCAEDALRSMDGADFEGRKLSVRWDRKPEKLDSEKAGKKPKPSKPRPKADTETNESMQEEEPEPQGDPLDMALSAPR